MKNAVFQEGLSQRAPHVTVPPCTSAIRALLDFSIAHRPPHNLLVKYECCHFAQVIGITSDPRTTFPHLLKVRASRCPLVQTGGDPIASKAPSTSWRRVPSVISVSIPINRCRARCTVGAPLTAISCPGAPRTPPVGVRGRGRHAGVRKPPGKESAGSGAPGSAGAMGIWGADAVQRGPVDAAGAAAGKGQRGATGRMGVVTAMVAGRWWVVEGC